MAVERRKTSGKSICHSPSYRGEKIYLGGNGESGASYVYVTDDLYFPRARLRLAMESCGHRGNETELDRGKERNVHTEHAPATI